MADPVAAPVAPEAESKVGWEGRCFMQGCILKNPLNLSHSRLSHLVSEDWWHKKALPLWLLEIHPWASCEGEVEFGCWISRRLGMPWWISEYCNGANGRIWIGWTVESKVRRLFHQGKQCTLHLSTEEEGWTLGGLFLEWQRACDGHRWSFHLANVITGLRSLLADTAYQVNERLYLFSTHYRVIMTVKATQYSEDVNIRPI